MIENLDMFVMLSNNKHECSTQMQLGFESTKACLMPDADIDRSAPCKREKNGSRWSHPRNCQFVQYCKLGNLSHPGTYFVNDIQLFFVTIFCFLHVTRREEESKLRVVMKLKMKGMIPRRRPRLM